MVWLVLIICLNRKVREKLMQVLPPKLDWQQALQLVRPRLCDASVEWPLRFEISYLQH